MVVSQEFPILCLFVAWAVILRFELYNPKRRCLWLHLLFSWALHCYGTFFNKYAMKVLNHLNTLIKPLSLQPFYPHLYVLKYHSTIITGLIYIYLNYFLHSINENILNYNSHSNVSEFCEQLIGFLFFSGWIFVVV